MLIDKALDYRETVQVFTSGLPATVEPFDQETAESLASALGRAGYALVRTTEDSPVKEKAADWFGREQDA